MDILTTKEAGMEGMFCLESNWPSVGIKCKCVRYGAGWRMCRAWDRHAGDTGEEDCGECNYRSWCGGGEGYFGRGDVCWSASKKSIIKNL